jgi:16S rRNA (cytidine1402-2'-O)-methyltransferase
LSASFTKALDAARDAAGMQHYPQGALYMVATPIGNLADISLRALHVLQTVDAIACEDTRHTQGMLRVYGIDKSGAQLLAVHQHNEVEAAQDVITRLQQGQRVAYVSDAGTPAVSDPGARLVAAVVQMGCKVVPLPGASSVTAALSACGAVAHNDAQMGFVFAGFLPTKLQARDAAVAALIHECRAVVVLEAPHRIEALAASLVTLGARVVTVGRELTKQFEEIVNVRAADLPGWLAQQPQRLKGEFVLVLHPVLAQEQLASSDRVLALLLAELPLKTAVKLAADITGEAKNALYTRALALKLD